MATDPTTPAPASVSASTRHPRGLYTLFFTEMWERFSYYGMRALLILFMTGPVQKGALGMEADVAGAVYGLYVAFVYLLSVPGGWIADRLLGAQRCVWYGGILIMAGHFTLAIPSTKTFFLGLVLVVLGTGLLKPNISAMVGELYPEGGARRDAGFTIFYMGINTGAFIGPLVCGYLGEKVDWHYGFGAAGIGMLCGLIQFRLTSRHLGEAGLKPHHKRLNPQAVDPAWYGLGLALLGIVVLAGLGLSGILRFNPIPLAKSMTYVIVGMGALYFIGIFLVGNLTVEEKKRCVALIFLLVAAALFWAGFEQAGSTLTVFADRHTDRVLESFNSYEIPASYFQSLNPAYIILLSPLVASFWITMARRNFIPSIPAKFAAALILLGLGFLVLWVAAGRWEATGQPVLPLWLVATYFLHTVGELCLSPVGLSSVTKLAPARFVGQMMGLWFLAASLGNLIAGLITGAFVGGGDKMTTTLSQVVMTTIGAGILLLILSRPIKKLMGNIR